jgi:hypothetical protein
MHFIDIKHNDNGKEIYKINTLLNTIVQFEAPYPKREIPQCKCLQKFGHTQNYCRNNSRCLKYAAEHLLVTGECPRKVRVDGVRCVNCNVKHPANYRGCTVHKEIKQKMYPRLRERNIATGPVQSGVTYVHAVQGQTEIPQ